MDIYSVYSCAENYPDIQDGGDENENEKQDSKLKWQSAQKW